MRPMIVLLTDFGLTDHYVGVMKGVIHSIHPDAVILDLAHGILPQNIIHGAMMVADHYTFFPKGSIFVCVVDPGVGSKRGIIGAKSKNYYFIGPDNGLLDLVLTHEKKYEVRLIENKKYFSTRKISATFHGRDIFSPIAAHLSRDREIFKSLGPKIPRIQRLIFPVIIRDKRCIQGEIVYFDHFGNGMTNIRKSDGASSFWKSASVRMGRRFLGVIRKTYSEGPKSLCAVFNSSLRLEICYPNGSAKHQGLLRIGNSVEVRG